MKIVSKSDNMNKKEFEERLILEMEATPIIYNKSCPEYRLRDRKDDAWRRIASALDFDGIYANQEMLVFIK